jgi:transcriptional regulator with XRE-family HTH domain
MDRRIVIRSGRDLTAAVGEVRRSQGLTQAELADRAVIRRPYLAQIESGRNSSILDHAIRLLRRLGAEVTVTFSTSPEGHEAGDGADGDT